MYGILMQDPALRPFEKDINLRMENYYAARRRLAGEGGVLVFQLDEVRVFRRKRPLHGGATPSRRPPSRPLPSRGRRAGRPRGSASDSGR